MAEDFIHTSTSPDTSTSTQVSSTCFKLDGAQRSTRPELTTGKRLDAPAVLTQTLHDAFLGNRDRGRRIWVQSQNLDL